MGLNNYWAGDIEMNISSYIFVISIVVYRETGDETCEGIEYIDSFNISKNDNEGIPILLLFHVSNNQLIYFNENNNNENFINYETFNKCSKDDSLNNDIEKNK